jgi:hypothetical protein
MSLSLPSCLGTVLGSSGVVTCVFVLVIYVTVFVIDNLGHHHYLHHELMSCICLHIHIYVHFMNTKVTGMIIYVGCKGNHKIKKYT